MKPPSVKDKFVRVTCYLTDQEFGADHWRAAQFSAPDASTRHPGILIICESAEEQREAMAYLEHRRSVTAS